MRVRKAREMRVMHVSRACHSAKRKVFIELPQDDEQEGCIGQMLRVFYARRRVNFRRQDLCLFNRLLPHSGARAWEHRFMEAT